MLSYLSIIQFVLVALAIYRVATMIAYERGPFSAFLYLRTWVYNRYGQKSWQMDGVGCPKCISFWLGWAGALLVTSSWLYYPVIALALSGAVCILVEAVHRG